eukprot:TRINITY_DN553_c0_g1_i1.p2 TRINITY_DN553_c0_g1~~TRINITY_DN553_c0_g1_i1.p2  ORF type:complete len:237 (+),score=47.80 TRINITY_DN553_c0_g1_i1:73-783(+)
MAFASTTPYYTTSALPTTSVQYAASPVQYVTGQQYVNSSPILSTGFTSSNALALDAADGVIDGRYFGAQISTGTTSFAQPQYTTSYAAQPQVVYQSAAPVVYQQPQQVVYQQPQQVVYQEPQQVVYQQPQQVVYQQQPQQVVYQSAAPVVYQQPAQQVVYQQPAPQVVYEAPQPVIVQPQVQQNIVLRNLDETDFHNPYANRQFDRLAGVKAAAAANQGRRQSAPAKSSGRRSRKQ